MQNLRKSVSNECNIARLPFKAFIDNDIANSL